VTAAVKVSERHYEHWSRREQAVTAEPRVLVLDEGFMSGTHTALGLTQAGCAVVVLAGTGGRGRHVGRGIAWSLAPRAGSDEFLRAVDATVRQSAFDYVYPVTEPIQEQLWTSGAGWLSKLYPCLEPWQRDLLGDKQRIAVYVGDRGVPVPAHRSVATRADADDAAQQFGFPVVVKGVRGRGGNATRIAASLDETWSAVQAMLRGGTRCFVQEYVDGPTYLVGGLFHDGCPIRVYAGRKIEQHPPRTGPAIRIRSVDDPTLLQSALTVFRELRWTGLASVDFIGGGGRQHLFLELNPRPWGSITAAADAGVDLFTPFAELLRGRTPTADLAFRPGVDSTIFPLYFLARAFWWRGRALGAAAQDLAGAQGAPWRSVGQAAHLLNRLYRVGRNWSRG
jgi:carbamoyl-phosphate synthase L subunit-like protein